MWDIKIYVRRSGVWISASEDKWCRKKEVEPGHIWRYGFEYSKPTGAKPRIPSPVGRPDFDFDEPVLLITKTDDELKILLEDFGGIYKVDIYVFNKLLWAKAGGITRSHVGDTKTVPIPTVPYPPIVPPPPRPPVIPPVVPPAVIPPRVVEVQLPNRLDKIEIDTSKTRWKSLRSELKGAVLWGFHIEDVGGGFTYKLSRGDWTSPEKTAVVDDKWDFEFDDLAVSGSGTAGTAILWYWWYEKPRLVRR